MRFGRIVFACAPFLTLALAAVACGDRTGLLVDDSTLPADVLDSGADTFHARDALPDSLPGIDVVRPDVITQNDCPDAAATLVYVITEDYQLYSFYPPTLAFKRIGAITCPGTLSTPFSMAVDRQGIARILYQDGRLFRVSTATAACQPTSFQPGQHGFLNFGMGYAADSDGGETLYVASDGFDAGAPSALATVDKGYVLHPVAPFANGVTGAELTGTGGGQLFGFYSPGLNSPDSYIGEIDRQSANIVGQVHLALPQGQGWAFAFWGGDFWVFTSPNGGTSTVTRYRPSDGSVRTMTTLPNVIVGAGVSTCAPQQ